MAALRKEFKALTGVYQGILCSNIRAQHFLGQKVVINVHGYDAHDASSDYQHITCMRLEQDQETQKSFHWQ